MGRCWTGFCCDTGATGAAADLEPVGVEIWLGGGNEDGAPAEGPPGGSVGNLMVGAAEGFGGKLMRTVSFLGWTLDASGGLGGTAPPGKLGMFSAINLLLFQGRVGCHGCQTLILKEKYCPGFSPAACPKLTRHRFAGVVGLNRLGHNLFDAGELERLCHMQIPGGS